MKSFPLLRTSAAGAIALFIAAGTPGKTSADEVGAYKDEVGATKSKAPAAVAPTPIPSAASSKEEEEPPTTMVSPSDDTAESDADTAKAIADANHCAQCQIQADAYRKLKAADDDALDNIKKNQALQAKLKPDEDKSAWIKVESNLRMWEIKTESLKKNLSALEVQMKDCQSCPQSEPTPAPSSPSSTDGTQKK